MKTTADVVIIGGGVVGTSILYNLGQLGVTDTLLIERDVLGSGSTGRSQAICRMHYSNEVTASMAWESLKVFANFNEVVGGRSGFVETGYLVVVEDIDRPGLERNVAMQFRLGIDTMVVTAADLQEIAPMVSVSENEAMGWEPQSGYADPYLVTSSYANRAQEMGAEVEMRNPAHGIEVSGGRVRAVNTALGRVETPVAVVAAGPWSKEELARTGVDVPLLPVRHQVASLTRPVDRLPVHPTVGDIAPVVLLSSRRPRHDPHGLWRRRGGRPGDLHPNGDHGRHVGGPGETEAAHPGDVGCLLPRRLVRPVHHHAGLAPHPGPGPGDRWPLLRHRLQRPRLQALSHDRAHHGRAHRSRERLDHRHFAAALLPFRRERSNRVQLPVSGTGLRQWPLLGTGAGTQEGPAAWYGTALSPPVPDRRCRRQWPLSCCGAAPASTVPDPLDLEVDRYRYSVVRWEASNFMDKWVHELWAILPWTSEPSRQERIALVREYFALGEEVRAMENRSVSPDVLAEEASRLQAGIAALRERREAMRADVEETVETEIGAVLAAEGFASRIGIIFPPVDTVFARSPAVLVTSPRDRIARLNSTLLQPDIGDEERAALEELVLEQRNLSAVVDKHRRSGLLPQRRLIFRQPP